MAYLEVNPETLIGRRSIFHFLTESGLLRIRR